MNNIVKHSLFILKLEQKNKLGNLIFNEPLFSFIN